MEGSVKVDKRKKRIGYVIITILIFLMELLIALFVRDNFIRPYIGDMLVPCCEFSFRKSQDFCHYMCFYLQREWKYYRESVL